MASRFNTRPYGSIYMETDLEIHLISTLDLHVNVYLYNLAHVCPHTQAHIHAQKSPLHIYGKSNLEK